MIFVCGDLVFHHSGLESLDVEVQINIHVVGVCAEPSPPAVNSWLVFTGAVDTAVLTFLGSQPLRIC